MKADRRQNTIPQGYHSIQMKVQGKKKLKDEF
jgi:hypothetical protein